MILKEGAWLAGAGLAAGLAGALLLTRLLGSLLIDVRPSDPLILATVAFVLGGSALAASWLPARRAARIDPAEALRIE